jgi:hypothetical protein
VTTLAIAINSKSMHKNVHPYHATKAAANCKIRTKYNLVFYQAKAIYHRKTRVFIVNKLNAKIKAVSHKK